MTLKSLLRSLVLIVAVASQTRALVVTPGRTEVHVVPGSSTAVSLTVMNDDEVEVDLELSTKDWFIPVEYREWTVDKWLALHGAKQFSLKSGQSRNVSLTLTCPAEMKGEVVGMVSFLYRAKVPSNVTPMISVSMYLMAAGYEKVEGLVEDLIVRTWEGRLSATAKVRSTGNVHLRPSGSLFITDSNGKELVRMPVAEGQPTYPGQEALYTGQSPEGMKFPKGKYELKADLKYQQLTLQKTRKFKVAKDGKIEMGKMR